MIRCEKCGTMLIYKSSLKRHYESTKCKALSVVKKNRSKNKVPYDTKYIGRLFPDLKETYIDWSPSLGGHTKRGYWLTDKQLQKLLNFYLPENMRHRKMRRIWQDDQYLIGERYNIYKVYKKINDVSRKWSFRVTEDYTRLYDRHGEPAGIQVLPEGKFKRKVDSIITAHCL